MKLNVRIMRRLALGLTSLMALVLFVAPASAGNNDFKLERLCVASGSCSSDDAVAQFKTLSRTYASVLAPMHFQPASSLGQAGFEIAVESKMSFSAKDDPSWKAINKNSGKSPVAGDDYAAPELFSTIQLHLRKGLPFSFEIEGVVNWLADSELFYVGAGLRWAITEGWWFLPDISIRGHVGTVVGAAQLSLINVNMDVAISYTWGLGGIASITPYAGYSLLTAFSSSRPMVILNPGQAATESVFRRQTNYMSRGFVGLQIKGDYFIFGLEGEFGKDIMSAGLKIGSQF